jgi:coniferyl-aldehyde dehydrogenase
MTGAHSNPDFDIAALLDRQRYAFLKAAPPSLEERKTRLKRLRAAVLAHRREVAEAVSADFGHRSRHDSMRFEG